MMKNEYLEAGKICTAHGIKGALKIEHLCDSPDVLKRQKTVYFNTGKGFVAKNVLSASVQGQFVLMLLEGISTREEAIAYRSKTLYLHRNDVPIAEGEMFIADMIGMPVKDAVSGIDYGELTDVSDATGRRIYTVRTPDGKEVMIPAVKEFIKEISPEGGMLITPIPGFFDEADEV
jgi:16S rRNA processing protein RimM